MNDRPTTPSPPPDFSLGGTRIYGVKPVTEIARTERKITSSLVVHGDVYRVQRHMATVPILAVLIEMRVRVFRCMIAFRCPLDTAPLQPLIRIEMLGDTLAVSPSLLFDVSTDFFWQSTDCALLGNVGQAATVARQLASGGFEQEDYRTMPPPSDLAQQLEEERQQLLRKIKEYQRLMLRQR